MKTPEPPVTKEDKLDVIIDYLDRMNRRDRLRTVGGFFRGLLGVVPLVVLLGSLWYLAENGDQLLQKIAATAAQQAMQATSSGTDVFVNSDVIKQLQDLLGR